MKIQIYRRSSYVKEEACLHVTGLVHGVRVSLYPTPGCLLLKWSCLLLVKHPLILSFLVTYLFYFVSPYRSDFASLKVSNTYASFQIELSAEAKAALLEFEERERQHKQGRYGSRRGGRRGGASLCRGVGDQRRESSERGRAKDHRPALLPTQPPAAVSCSAPSWEPARDENLVKGVTAKVSL